MQGHEIALALQGVIGQLRPSEFFKTTSRLAPI
jgi:hypothetical protein